MGTVQRISQRNGIIYNHEHTRCKAWRDTAAAELKSSNTQLNDTCTKGVCNHPNIFHARACKLAIQLRATWHHSRRPPRREAVAKSLCGSTSTTCACRHVVFLPLLIHGLSGVLCIFMLQPMRRLNLHPFCVALGADHGLSSLHIQTTRRRYLHGCTGGHVLALAIHACTNYMAWIADCKPCMHVCMQACMHACNVCMYACMHLRSYADVHRYTYVYIYIYTYICIYTHYFWWT